VRAVQKEENKKFARECQDHGCDKEGIAAASKAVNKNTYTVTPKDKNLDNWTEEEQQRQAIAKRKASDDIVAIGPHGNHEVTKVAGDAAKEAKQLVNHHGVDTIWEFFFGKKTGPVEEPTIESEEPEEPEFLTRAQQIAKEQAALKEQLKNSGGGSESIEPAPPEEKPFKPFIFF
jgi:hypothetical protein